MDIRTAITLVENTYMGIPGIKVRYAVLDPSDLIDMAGRFASAEEFATKVLDPSSPDKERGFASIARIWHASRATTKRADGLGNAPPLAVHIANAIGATAYQKVREVPWGNDVMFGPDCYVLTTPAGGVFLDASVYEKHSVLGRPSGQWEIGLSQISVENRASGLGTKVMEAIRTYAVEKGLKFSAYKVTNAEFFKRFPWLRQTDPHTFAFDPTSDA